MANSGQELSSISFGSIIGGALNALIEAQSQAAYTTIDFINSVGFSAADASGQKKPTYVAFRYTKEISPYLLATDTEPERQAVTRDMLLQVPLLTMLLVPFIRIADAIIDFNAKINSVTTTSNQKSNSYGGSLDVDTSFSFWRLKTSAKRNATLPNQKTSSYEEAIKRDYSLGIHYPSNTRSGAGRHRATAGYFAGCHCFGGCRCNQRRHEKTVCKHPCEIIRRACK